jgi:ribosomal protein L37AE/L43A
MSEPTPRAQPFYCPYCGEQDLRPGATGGWHCRVCDRRFELTFSGLGSDEERAP